MYSIWVLLKSADNMDHNAAYYKRTLPTLKSLILSRLCCLVPRHVWSGFRPGWAGRHHSLSSLAGRQAGRQGGRQGGRQAELNADTSLTSARESGPLGDAETSAQHHFRFTTGGTHVLVCCRIRRTCHTIYITRTGKIPREAEMMRVGRKIVPQGHTPFK